MPIEPIEPIMPIKPIKLIPGYVFYFPRNFLSR